MENEGGRKDLGVWKSTGKSMRQTGKCKENEGQTARHGEGSDDTRVSESASLEAGDECLEY